MRVWDGLKSVPHLDGAVVTLGMFAGMHRGHREVIAQTVAEARALGVPAVAVTFTPHPIEVHQPGRDLVQLATLKQRMRDLAAEGLDAVLLIEYTLEFSAHTPEEFVRDYLVEGLAARAVVIGEDARFGTGNAGDEHTMRELGERFGFTTTVVRDLCCPETGRRWSSTWVREALTAGNVQEAARVLGHPHTVRGEVIHGAKRGRELGYPTANLDPEEMGYVPEDGVYAGWLVDGSERYPAAISVGTNPQFDGVTRTVEAHVLGRTDLDLYGHVVDVEFTDRIRAMETFGSLEEFLERLALDIEESADLLGVPRPARPALPAAAEA